MSTELDQVIAVSEEFLSVHDSTQVRDHLLTLYSIRLWALADQYLVLRQPSLWAEIQSLFHRSLSLRNSASTTGQLAILAVGAYIAIRENNEVMLERILGSMRSAIQGAAWNALGHVVQQLRKLYEIFPHIVELRELLGLVMLRFGQGLATQALQTFEKEKIDTAAETWEQGLSLIPEEISRDSIESRFQLATLYTNQGKLDHALAWAQKAIALQSQIAHEHRLGKQNIRFFQTRSATLTNIGQLVNEMEFFHKSRLLGIHPQYRSVLLAPYRHVINKMMLTYWRDHTLAVTSEALCRRLTKLGEKLEIDTFYYQIPGKQLDFQWRGMIALQQKWDSEGRGPLLHLKKSHQSRAEAALTELGVPAGAWWVALHVRDISQGKFGKAVVSKPTSNRDADILTYEAAIRAITERGGWVIRLGDPSMKKMVPMDNFIDYPHSSQRKPWLDIYIAAAAKFFMGTASGMCGVPMNFGVPLLMTNTAPTMSLPVGKADRFIFKLLRESRSGRLLDFAELFSPPYDLCYNVGVYEERGVEILNNTEEELEAAAIEMLEELENSSQSSSVDQRTKRFNYLVERCQPTGLQSRISSFFLRKYLPLLEEGEARLGIKPETVLFEPKAALSSAAVKPSMPPMLTGSDLSSIKLLF